MFKLVMQNGLFRGTKKNNYTNLKNSGGNTMIITKKIENIKASPLIAKYLEDANASSKQVDYLIGLLEYENEVILRSIAFGDHDYYHTTYLQLEDYFFVIQNYNELVNTLELFKAYYQQMDDEDLKGGE